MEEVIVVMNELVAKFAPGYRSAYVEVINLTDQPITLWEFRLISSIVQPEHYADRTEAQQAQVSATGWMPGTQILAKRSATVQLRVHDAYDLKEYGPEFYLRVKLAGKDAVLNPTRIPLRFS